MALDLFKEVLPSIMQTKKNVLVSDDDVKSYSPFVVNRALSFHIDCVHHANEMNKYPSLPNAMQYNYLLHSIRGIKRKFQPWQKADVVKDIESIMLYYGYSREKAKTAMGLMTKEQIAEVVKMTDPGGPKK